MTQEPIGRSSITAELLGTVACKLSGFKALKVKVELSQSEDKSLFPMWVLWVSIYEVGSRASLRTTVSIQSHRVAIESEVAWPAEYTGDMTGSARHLEWLTQVHKLFEAITGDFNKLKGLKCVG